MYFAIVNSSSGLIVSSLRLMIRWGKSGTHLLPFNAMRVHLKAEIQFAKIAASGGLWLPADPLRQVFCILKLYHNMHKYATKNGHDLEKSPKSTGFTHTFWR